MDGFDQVNAPDSMAIREDFIPASDYTSPDMLRLEKNNLWPKVWQIACRVEEIPRLGDFVNYKIFDESILVTRTAEDRIQAFYNTCQHRGRRLRDEEKGHAGQWYCRFHGWRYDLDGKIAYVHDREDWAGCPTFKEEELDLKQVKVATWAGWVFINQDPDSEPLEAYLGAVKTALDPFAWENARMAWHETIIAPVNWKVVVEAFNETYHAGATHVGGFRYTGVRGPGAAHGRHGMFFPEYRASRPAEYLDPETGHWVQAKTAAEGIWAAQRHQHRTLFALTLDPLMAACERLKDECGPDYPLEKLQPRLMELHKEELAKRGVDWPEGLTQEAIDRAGTDWHIFPNSIVLPTADSALWYRVRPNRDDPDSCIFDIWSLGRYAPGQEPKVTRGETVGFEAFRGKNPFLEEDFDNMEAVHEGMKSRGFIGARTNPVQENQTVNFHRALHAYVYGDGWPATGSGDEPAPS